MNDQAMKRVLDLAPECDERCGLCLNTESWKCIEYEDTNYDTTIYTYVCNHYDPVEEIVCDNETTLEFDVE